MTEAEREAQLMHMEVITASLACHVAEQELSELGITASPADTSAWLNADRKQRKELALQWAVMVSNDWAKAGS